MLSIIEAAGWPIWPLMICSIVAMTLVIERAVALRRSRVVPRRLADEVVNAVRSDLLAPDAISKLERNSVLGTVLASGIRSIAFDPRIGEEGLRKALESAGRVAVHRLERYLGTLGTIASAAPMLGLLGTVVGMIEIFGSQSPTGGSNPAQLAHGISIALYNTAFGLIIAVPALMFHRHFRRRVEEYTIEMEQAAEKLVPHLLRHAPRKRVIGVAA